MNIKPRAARRLLTRFLTAAGIAVGVAAVADAQQPAATKRVATLLPPQPLDAGERAPVARGAMDDTPFTPANTKAARPATGGPAWLTGAPDPNVRPIAGSVPRPSSPQPNVPGERPAGDPTFFTRGLDKVRNAVGMEKRPQAEAMTGRQPNPRDPRDLPTANTPFQGTSASGAPVYAGPPAYRWFGYGTVTPGTNALAPSGQYPRPSAEWHRLTGATPGAVPVPVSNPAQAPAGSEPPTYPSPPPIIRTQAPTSPPVSVAPMETTRVAASPIHTDAPRFVPNPVPFDPPKPAPNRTIPPTTAPVGIPIMTPPPMSRPAPSGPIAVPEVRVPTLSEPPPPSSVVPSVGPTGTAVPAHLPVSLTDDARWQPTTGKPDDAWIPVGGRPVASDPSWQPGAANTTAVPVARGQAPQAQQSDPVVALIKSLCQHHRATDVDVRYVGTKKLSVCFEVRGEAAANRLVKDIGNRKELLPYQIDFCVLVK